MNAISYDHTPRQIALIKDTIAKDCNNDEFNLFVEVARGKGLDPFLGQIIPMVFSKDNPKKRKMTLAFELPRGSYATLVVKRLTAGDGAG